jgi:hypothetical protein
VYFTPPEVAGAQVRLVEHVLRERLGCDSGFGGDRVRIVDPACGTGAYPLAILERAPEAAGRMRLFETLAGPARIARERGLPVVQRNALTADDVAEDAEVVVVIGNPPYRRRTKSATLSLDNFCADAAGVHHKNLHNEYVYFWRWALRVAFETRPGPGIVCFVTAASYLRGPAFGGMRRELRHALDELWLIDLEGDQRASRASANVFPIRTPVAIALGVRYGDAREAAPAVVRYTRIEGDAAHKLCVLDSLSKPGDLAWQSVTSGWQQPLYAASRSEYWRWPALSDLFPWQISGVQFKRTWPIGSTPEVLRSRWERLLEMPDGERRRAFGRTRDRDVHSSPPDLLSGERRLPPLDGLAPDTSCVEPVRYAYRAFDRHWVLPDARLGDFMRPRLWRAAGPRQVFLTSMLTNVLGPGPAAVATRHVPDLDHFRGSFGARGVIPLWLDAEATRPNVCVAWLERLSQRYGRVVRPPELMAYCYAVLAAPSYTRRFADELRTPGPRVPLPLEAAEFLRGVALGEELLAIHTYRRVMPGAARVIREASCRYPTGYQYDTPQEQLVLGEVCVGPVSRDVWAYGVSGYRVVNGWLRRRLRPRGKSPLDAIGPTRWDTSLSRELLELLWLVEATLAMGPALDALLDQAVIQAETVKPAGITDAPRN